MSSAIGNMPNPGTPARNARRNLWRWAGVTAVILSVPFIAMFFAQEVQWTASDFVIAATILFGLGALFEVAARYIGTNAYRRAGLAFALIATLVILWANGAVGMIGNEDNPVNFIFLGVIGIALLGSIIARFKLRGMAISMALAGATQATIGLWAWISVIDTQGGRFTLLLSGLWFLSAASFWAADEQRP